MNPRTRLGKYTLVSYLGGGGFGRVYRAIQGGPEGFSRPVAVKVLRPSPQRKQATEEFVREARTIARLQHRNIVQVYEFTVEENQYLLVMELIEGLTLSSLMRPPVGPLPFWLGLAVAQEVCRGLCFAHSLAGDDGQPLGVIHRDVKPSNILVSQQGDVKLTDFGIAKMSALDSDQLTDVGVVKGTPSYMSPEQWRGEAIAASDVFSLAAVLYELCTGITFAAISPRGAAGVTHLDPPSRFSDAIPRELDAVLLASLSHDPRQRPSSGELLQDLQKVLAAAAPPGQLSRFNEELAEWVNRAGLRVLTAPVEPPRALSGARLLTESNSQQVEVPFAPRAIVAAGIPPGAEPRAEKRPAPAELDPSAIAQLTTMDLELRSEAAARTRSVAAAPPRGRRRTPLRRLGFMLLGLVWTCTVAAGIWAFLQDRRPPLDLAAGSTAPSDLPPPAPDAAVPDRARLEARVEASASRPDARPEAPRPDARARQHRPRKTQPARAAWGQLSVNAEPWAKVFLDGKSIGVTPIFQSRVPSGAHQLKLVGSNGRVVTRQVNVPFDGHLRLGMIPLGR